MDESGDVREVRIEEIYYPIYPYGNYVKDVTVIRWVGGDLPVCIESYTVRMSWNGTGRDDNFKLCFNDYSTEEPRFLWRDELESIETVDDLKKYMELVKDYILGLWGE